MHFLERGLNWSTLAYVVFVCLAAGASFLLALFAGRVTNAKDMELKRLQNNSAEAVAHAHAGAARANAQAAEAMREQRRLEADVAHAKAHHEQLRRQNLELQLAVEKERAARLQLESRSTGRHIGAAQKQAMQPALANFRGEKVMLVTFAGDQESAAFAGDIRSILEGVGLNVSNAPAVAVGKPQAGIAMEVGAKRRPLAMALAKAFVDAGVCSGPLSATESDHPDLLEITVGPKQ